MSEEDILQQRKEILFSYMKKNYNLVSYIILAVIVFISVRIRTLNLDKLRDITTGTWTLGPDLDPFFFLRWAEYIVENGSLFAVDTMRYVPLGFDTKLELILHPYMMAWFHKLASIFGSESVTHSAVLYPVFMFALTVIAFFFLARKIFVEHVGEKKANIIALISSFFLAVLPPLLARTIAGIPEKESVAFLFMFLSLYFFLCAWKSDSFKPRIIFSLLAGISTAGMALIWGGYAYIYLVISTTTMIAFLFGQVTKKKLQVYSIWLIISFIIMMVVLPARYTFRVISQSTVTDSSIFVLFVILIHLLIFRTSIKRYFSKFHKIPRPIISLLATLMAGIIISSVLLGPHFIFDTIKYVLDNLITPATSRLIQTVAENRQPYFGEWGNSYGPMLFSKIPIFFWLFFSGSVYLFYKMIHVLRKKERVLFTLSYLFFLISIVFSRYSIESIFNGTNFQSLAFYSIGFGVFIWTAGYYYYKYYKNEEQMKFREIDFAIILLFS